MRPQQDFWVLGPIFGVKGCKYLPLELDKHHFTPLWYTASCCNKVQRTVVAFGKLKSAVL